jgi:hypothetical protein
VRESIRAVAVNLDFVPDYPLEGGGIGIRDMVHGCIGVELTDGLDEAHR